MIQEIEPEVIGTYQGGQDNPTNVSIPKTPKKTTKPNTKTKVEKEENAPSNFSEAASTLEKDVEQIKEQIDTVSKEQGPPGRDANEERVIREVLKNIPIPKDGRNPITISKVMPSNPQKGDLWFKD